MNYKQYCAAPATFSSRPDPEPAIYACQMDATIRCSSFHQRNVMEEAILLCTKAVQRNDARVMPVLETLGCMNLDETHEVFSARDGAMNGMMFTGTVDAGNRRYTIGRGANTINLNALYGEKNLNSPSAAGIRAGKQLAAAMSAAASSPSLSAYMSHVAEALREREATEATRYFADMERAAASSGRIEIRDIFFGPKATTVKWSDGTTTTVKRRKGDDDNPDIAVAMAIVKKYYGSMPKYHKFVAGFVEKSRERYKNRLNRLLRKDRRMMTDEGHTLAPGDANRMGAILEWLHPEHVYFEKDMNTDAFARADRVDPKVNVFPSGSVKRLSNVLKNATEQPAAEPIDRTDE